MSYITLGNMRRFLNKLKGYLSNNYLQLSGGTVTGDTIFKKKISAHEVCLTGLSDVSLVNKDNGSIAKDGLTILDEGNYNLFTPTIHGTGATGTWDINISGNALNDSEGNKIVDTYAKKSEVGSTPDLTLYMKQTADSDLDMQDRDILMGAMRISSEKGFIIDAANDQLNFLGSGVFLNGSPLDTRANNQILYAPKESPTFTGVVTATDVKVSTSLTIPGGKVWIE